MAKNDPASIVAGAGLLTGIFTKLNAEVTALGGTAEDIHRLTTPAGNETIRQIAKLVTAEGAILHRPLEFLGFNGNYTPDVRLRNCLVRVGIETVGDLVTKTPAQLYEIPNFGERSLGLLREKLARHGLALRGEEASPFELDESWRNIGIRAGPRLQDHRRPVACSHRNAR